MNDNSVGYLLKGIKAMPYDPENEFVATAKGKYLLPTNWTEVRKLIKRQWLKKRQK